MEDHLLKFRRSLSSLYPSVKEALMKNGPRAKEALMKNGPLVKEALIKNGECLNKAYQILSKGNPISRKMVLGGIVVVLVTKIADSALYHLKLQKDVHETIEHSQKEMAKKIETFEDGQKEMAKNIEESQQQTITLIVKSHTSLSNDQTLVLEAVQDLGKQMEEYGKADKRQMEMKEDMKKGNAAEFLDAKDIIKVSAGVDYYKKIPPFMKRTAAEVLVDNGIIKVPTGVDYYKKTLKFKKGTAGEFFVANGIIKVSAEVDNYMKTPKFGLSIVIKP